MSVELATPIAALAGLAGLVPLAVWLVQSQARQAASAASSGCPSPRCPPAFSGPRPGVRLRAARPRGGAAVAGAPARTARAHGRQMLLVLDNSRSMLASSGPRTRPRFRRAAFFARKLRADLPELPTGVAALNNRLLPYLFPTVDEQAFSLVVARALRHPEAAAGGSIRSRRDRLRPAERGHDANVLLAAGEGARAVVPSRMPVARPFDARGTLSRTPPRADDAGGRCFWHPGERIRTRPLPVHAARRPRRAAGRRPARLFGDGESCPPSSGAYARATLAPARPRM